MTEAQPAGRDEVEVAHEALIRHWPRLRAWLDQDRAALLLRETIREAAQEWERHDRDESYLAHRGRRLAEAEGLTNHPRFTLNSQERAYLDAAIALRRREEQERETQQQRELTAQRERAEMAEQRVAEQAVTARRLQRRLLVAVGLGALAVLAAIGAFWQFRQATTEANARATEVVVRTAAEAQAAQEREAQVQATVRRLTAQSLSLADDRLDLSLLLGLAANRISDTPDTRGVIATALSSSQHLVKYLRGDPESGRSLAFSPDGNLLAVARDGGIDVWDIVAGERVAPALIGHAGAVISVAFSPADANLLASAGVDGTIRLWDIAGRRPSGEPLVGHSDTVNSIAFTPDGTKLVSGSEDGTVIVWNVGERRQTGEPLAADDAVTSLAVSPDGKTFAVGGGFDTIALWDTETRHPIRDLTTGEYVSTFSLAFSPTDATILASGGNDGTVRLWNVTTGEERGTPSLDHRGVVSNLAFSETGDTLASGGFDGTIRLWDVQTRQVIDEPLTGHGRIVDGLAFRPGSGSPALASSSEDGRVILWDVEVRHRLGSLGPNRAKMGVALAVRDLTFGPDETTLAFTTWGVDLWDVMKRQRIQAVAVRFGYDRPAVMAFNPQDRGMLAVGTYDGSVAFWDVTTGARLVSPVAAHTKAVQDVAFNPDGTLMVSASEDGTVQLWDPAKMASVGPAITGYAEEVMSVAFSPIDADLLAFGGTEGTLVLWDIEAGRPRVEPLVGHEGRVTSVAFSPDGRLLVSGSADGTMQRWDPTTGEAQGQFPIAESSNVTTVAFRPDGTLLAAGDAGGSIHLWDVATRQLLGSSLTGHATTVLSLAFSPNGRMLASGGVDGQIMLWDVDFDSWRALACGLAGRNLTTEEWRQYLDAEPYQATCPGDLLHAETIAGVQPEVAEGTTAKVDTDATNATPRATPADPVPVEDSGEGRNPVDPEELQGLRIEPMETAAVDFASGVTGNSYTGTNFDHRLVWDEDVWTVEGVSATEGNDWLRLTGSPGVVEVESFAGSGGDPEACLRNAAAELRALPGASGLSIASDLDQPTTVKDVPSAAAVLRYTYEPEGGGTQMVLFVECRTLVEGDGVVKTNYLTSASDYVEGLPFVEELLAGLVLPGEPAATPATPALNNVLGNSTRSAILRVGLAPTGHRFRDAGRPFG